MNEKREIIITGMMKRDDGRAEVQLPDGRWLLTSPMVSYFVGGGTVYIETKNSIYKTAEYNKDVCFIDSVSFSNLADKQGVVRGYAYVVTESRRNAFWISGDDIERYHEDGFETANTIYKKRNLQLKSAAV